MSSWNMVLLNILMILAKRKMDNFDPYNVFLVIATNIAVPLMLFCAPTNDVTSEFFTHPHTD